MHRAAFIVMMTVFLLMAVMPAGDRARAADGLADTPWPMFRHDLQHTGRSPYVGPATPVLKLSYATGNDISSSPAIGADGTVYVGSYDNKLYAFEWDTTPPAVPTLVSPADGAKTNDTTPALGWSDVSDLSGVTYSLQVNNNSDFSSPALNRVGLSTSDYTLATGEALSPGTYFWRVKAIDGAPNESNWISAWSFTIETGAPPVAPSEGLSPILVALILAGTIAVGILGYWGGRLARRGP